MNENDLNDAAHSLEHIRTQALGGYFRLTVHAHQEMVEENVLLEDVIEAIDRGEILENYPDHRRGHAVL